MKLRIQGNSIRFRLGRAEVARFLELGIVEDSVNFPQPIGSHIIYALESKPGISALDSRFEEGRLRVQVPADEVQTWATSDRVEIQAELPIKPAEVLKILIEKDFQCLHRTTSESRADAYPNPMAQLNRR